MKIKPYFVQGTDKRTMNFGHYYVVENSKIFYGIYEEYSKRLISSKTSWKQATKLAKMLQEAYEEGYYSNSDW